MYRALALITIVFTFCSQSQGYTLNFDREELVCQIALPMKALNLEALRQETKQQIDFYTNDIENSDSSEGIETFDFRIPFLKHILYWFFSTKEFSYPIAYNRPLSAPPTGAINYFGALNRLQSESSKHNPAPNLIEAPDTLTKVVFLAKKNPPLTFGGPPLEPEVVIQHPEIVDARTKQQIYDTFSYYASQLTFELLQKPFRSVNQNQLLDMALEVTQGDLFSALGTLATLFLFDANMLPRKLLSVLSSKVTPLFVEDDSDHAGTIYHFWNYLARGIVQPDQRLHLWLMSLGYEKLNQGDSLDYAADMFGLEIAKEVEAKIQSCTPRN